MRKLKLMAAMLLITLAAGCTTLGLTTPQSPSQGLAYAYGSVAAARTSAAQALQSGAITTTQAQQILALTDQARAYLDAGETLIVQGGDTSSVAGDLALATNILAQVSALLPQK